MRRMAILIIVSILSLLLIFGFGEEGWRILRVSEFWTLINTLLLGIIIVLLLKK